jgi:hypothetical protein
MTNAATIRDAINERPFRPFTVRTVSGREFHVPTPEHAIVSPGGRTLVIFFEDDATKVLDMRTVEGIDYPPPAPPAKRASGIKNRPAGGAIRSGPADTNRSRDMIRA